MVSRIVTTKPTAVEARSEARRRMLKHVQVLSLDRKASSVIDLTLRNVSTSGAQLFGPSESIGRLPDEFYLVPPGQLRMVRCRIVWRAHDLVGVSFVTEHGQPAPERLVDEAHAPGGGFGAENYVLDQTTGAVVNRDVLLSGKAPDDDIGSLERAVSEALGLKVEITAAGPSGGRIAVHVRNEGQLRDVCRRLVRPD